jgi:predicted nucleic acid-binding protein
VTKYLLDTNVISDINEQEIYLSVLVIGELRCGVELIRRSDPDAASHII